MLVAAAACLLLLAPQGEPGSATSKASQNLVPELGSWLGWLDSPGGELQFEMRIWRQAGGYRLTVINGPERIHYDEVRVKAGLLRARLAPYDSHLRARVHGAGKRLVGLWTKARGGGRRVRMVFEARAGRRPRWPPVPADISGRWAVQFEKGEHPAVGILEAVKGGAVNGTFLTTLGDYRFLSGTFRGGSLNLSCFDGAHAFLFRAELQQDGSLQGDF